MTLSLVPPRLVVIWFDPGVTVGWCLLRVPLDRLLDNGQVAARPWVQFKAGQYKMGGTSANVDRALDMARVADVDLCEDGDRFVLGAEGFTLRMLSMDEELLEPVRWLAVLRDRLRGSGQALEIQGASDALRTITDDRLKAWDLWHSSEHARAATKHALLYLRRYVKLSEVRQRARVIVDPDQAALN